MEMRLHATIRHLRILNGSCRQNGAIELDMPESGERFRLLVGNRLFRRLEHRLVLQQG